MTVKYHKAWVTKPNGDKFECQASEIITLQIGETVEWVNEADPYVEIVKKKFDDRSNVGKEKYGVDLTRVDLSFFDWLVHLQEELMDATLYIERLKKEEMDRNY